MKLHTFLTIAAMGAALANAQDNQLNAEETAAGYDLPFDGSANSLTTNWHGYRTTYIPDVWEVKTNAPLGPRIENKQGTAVPILTNKKYTNFDLKIEVMVPTKTNSGIFARYEETAPSPSDRRSGPEMQICEDTHSDCGGLKTGFGACYDMFPVDAARRSTWYKPSGNWNQMRIIAFDSNYVHYGNGKKLLEYKIGTQAFLTAYNASKYTSDGNDGRYYHIHPGGILLQHHGEWGVAFRNIKIKALTVHPFKQEFKNGAWPDTLAQTYALGVPTAVSSGPEAPGPDDIRLSNAGADLFRVTAPEGHSEFKAMGIDGRAIPFRKAGDGAYLLARGDIPSGIVVVRIRAEGRVLSRILGLP